MVHDGSRIKRSHGAWGQSKTRESWCMRLVKKTGIMVYEVLRCMRSVRYMGVHAAWGQSDTWEPMVLEVSQIHGRHGVWGQSDTWEVMVRRSVSDMEEWRNPWDRRAASGMCFTVGALYLSCYVCQVLSISSAIFLLLQVLLVPGAYIIQYVVFLVGCSVFQAAYCLQVLPVRRPLHWLLLHAPGPAHLPGPQGGAHTHLRRLRGQGMTGTSYTHVGTTGRPQTCRPQLGICRNRTIFAVFRTKLYLHTTNVHTMNEKISN
jgi:hypothetical protein